MTNPAYTVIKIVADRSGSMSEYADPPVSKATRSTEGVHSIVTEQRKLPGRTEFSLTDFDSDGRTRIALGNGDEILKWKCQPRNSTPLLDAVGSSIAEMGEELEKMPEDERPGRVIFVIATDGKENCSQDYKREQVGEMIERQRTQYAWDFLFLGAGFEDFDAEAASINVSMAATMSSTPVAMAAAYSSANDAITRARQFDYPVGYNLDDRAKVAAAEAGASDEEQ